MKLSDLAFACHVYQGMTAFDTDYKNLTEGTGTGVDLGNSSHRVLLIRWLRKWGCRQFDKKHEVLASGEIETWYRTWRSSLPPAVRELVDLTDGELDAVDEAHNALAGHAAGKRKGKKVCIGPTGASKILFALRPHALLPTDEVIRKKLCTDPNSYSYSRVIRRAMADVQDLAQQCRQHSLKLSDLPAKLGQKDATIPKLIDEYYWVTITRKCQPPAKRTMKDWLEWA